MRAIDPAALPDAVAAEWADLVERARRVSEAAVEVAADVDAQSRFREADGVLSTHAWLRGRHRLSGAEAQWRLQVARFLDRAPQWKRAFADGLVAIARSAARVVAAGPQRWSAAEDHYFEVVRPARSFDIVVDGVQA
ncbi:MAG: hypothetical protein AAGF73_06420 [Actinomycetota bacterium]